MIAPLKLPPGIYRAGTKYSSKGRWYDANLVRWLDGTLRPVGGWYPLTTLGFVGDPVVDGALSGGETTLDVRAAVGKTIAGVIVAGTTFQLAGETGAPTHTVTGGPYIITGNAISTLTFTTAVVGAVADGAAITFSAGTGQRVQITGGMARAALAWLSETGGQAYLALGHTHGLALYSEGIFSDISPAGFTNGLDDAATTGVEVRHYGDGFYGFGPYGIAQPLQGRRTPPDVWTLDTFASWLVGCMAQSDGAIYRFRPGTDSVAVAVGSFSGTAPTDCRAVCTTPEGFLVALGANGDPRLVMWASQGTVDSWDEVAADSLGAASSAGKYWIESAGQLLTGKRGRGETLLFTDLDVTAMSFIGGDLVYSFENRGRNCGVIGPNAVARIDSRFVWMGSKSFYLYDGFVQPLPCEVADYIFSDFNAQEQFKVAAVVLSDYGEVWWFYPSASSSECDRYVVWSYREGHWAFGQLARACGVEAGNGFPAPILVATDGVVYQHETGTDHGGATPYAESGPVEIGDGEQVMHCRQLIPDERTKVDPHVPDVTAYFYTQFYPNGVETEYGPYSLANPTDVRLGARSMRVRVEELRPSNWRVGTFRFDVVSAGKR